ncbi:MAG: CPBP family intramembrane metalloprotease [Verrucomicrobia subdivision 3 bacterium]|nr:CPBP family intramembrane metalloprotease [Limisphaerales bacterium]
MPATTTAEAALPKSRTNRLTAIAEVLLAFAAVHAAFRAIKHFTDLGKLDVAAKLNFTPGAVMILFTVAILVICHRSFAAYGLTFAEWKNGLKAGLLCGALIIFVAALLTVLRIRHEPGRGPPGLTVGIGYGLVCAGGVLILGWLWKRQEKLLSRVPPTACFAVLIAVLCVPLLLAWRYGHPLLHAALTTLWLVVGAGVGEEMFYRGYVQSRINEAFGRPFRIKGLQFGVGLLLSTLLFGFLHALNSVDYFHGRWTFAWGFGIAALGTGAIFGWLRERTGSIIAGAVAHSILDVLARASTMIP